MDIFINLINNVSDSVVRFILSSPYKPSQIAIPANLYAGMNIFFGIQLAYIGKTLVNELMGNVPSYLLKSEGVPFGLTTGLRCAKIFFPAYDNQHKVVLGGTGAGKTEWAMQYVINRPGGVAYFENADGKAIDKILAALPEDRLKKTVVLDHSNKWYPLPIGKVAQEKDIFVQDAIVSQWVSFFEANFNISQQFMTSEMIAYSCKAVFSVPGSTFYDVVRFVKEEGFRQSILRQINDIEVIRWWMEFSEKRKPEQQRITAAFLHRAEVLFRERFMRATLGNQSQGLDYRKWMDEGYTVLIKAPESLGELSVRVIMAVHALSFWQAALSRDSVPEGLFSRPPFMLIADEPQTWLFNNAATIDNVFSKGRKYGFGMMCLFQSFEQIAEESPKLLHKIRDNQPDMIVFRTSKKKIDLGKDHGKEKDPEMIPKFFFYARINGCKYFFAETLGKVQPIREDINRILRNNRDTFNIQYGRSRSWPDVANTKGKKSELQKNGLGSTASQDLQSETKRSSGRLVLYG